MSITQGLQLPFGIQPVNPVPVDSWSGPYDGVSLQDAIDLANLTIPVETRFQSMEVRLIVGGESKKFWYRDGVGPTDLIEFGLGTIGVTGATGIQGVTGPTGPTGSSLTIYESGETPIVDINEIEVIGATVTDDGGGKVTLEIEAGGITSVNGQTTPSVVVDLQSVLDNGNVANDVEVFIIGGNKRLAFSGGNVEITNLDDENLTYRDDLGFYVVDTTGNESAFLKEKITTENGEYLIPTGVSSPLATLADISGGGGTPTFEEVLTEGNVTTKNFIQKIDDDNYIEYNLDNFRINSFTTFFGTYDSYNSLILDGNGGVSVFDTNQQSDFIGFDNGRGLVITDASTPFLVLNRDSLTRNGFIYPLPSGPSSPLATLADITAINEHYKGTYTSISALQTAHSTANLGDYALVDAGSGSDAKMYIWDADEGWVLSGSVSLTTTDALPEGTTNLYFTSARALAAIPDASIITKGLAKLYNNILTSNTDGGVTQAALKTEFENIGNSISTINSKLINNNLRKEFDWNEGVYIMEHYIGASFTAPYTSASGSGGSATSGSNVTGAKFGGLVLSTGTVTSFGLGAIVFGNVNTPPINLSDSSFYMKRRVKIPILSTTSEAFYIQDGFIGNGNRVNPSASILFLYDTEGSFAFGASPGSIKFKTVTSLSSSRTFTDTGVIVVADQWYELLIYFITGTNTVMFYIDNVLVATHTTNIPNIPVSLNHSISKTNGTSARTYEADKMQFQSQ